MKNLFNRLLSKITGNGIPNPEKSYLFVDVLKEYIKKYIDENQLGEGTVKRYAVYEKNILNFMIELHYYHLRVSDVKVKHMEELRSWLYKNLKTAKVTHVSRHLELCKRITNYAVLMEYSGQDFLSPVEAKRDRVKNVVHLEVNELKALMIYSFQSQLYRKAADLFIFQCYTGMSYSSLYNYSLVIKKVNGIEHYWFEGVRDKSSEMFAVWAFNEALAIHNKYGGKLPIISNQIYNRVLKEIAHALGIKKHLTTHVGRKTHATLLDQKGVTTKTISQQLGNTERVVEKHYVKKSPLRQEKELAVLQLA